MSYEPKIHEAQIEIVRCLLFTPRATFASLQKSAGLTSDHFSFHLRRLVDERLVEKDNVGYRLTIKGKEYANRMDTDEKAIERQPKISVVVTLERKNAKGEREFLFQQRRKNPYFGFWGRIGGKMRWGETVTGAAARELEEETGLIVELEDLEYKTLYHKRDFNKITGELLEDKIFLCVYATKYRGVLKEEFEGGVNRWMTFDEFHEQPKRFNSVNEFTELMERGEHFAERDFYYEPTEY